MLIILFFRVKKVQFCGYSMPLKPSVSQHPLCNVCQELPILRCLFIIYRKPFILANDLCCGTILGALKCVQKDMQNIVDTEGKIKGPLNTV